MTLPSATSNRRQSDEKYGKRRQQRQQRLERSVLLFGGAMTVLFICWTSLVRQAPTEDHAMSMRSLTNSLRKNDDRAERLHQQAKQKNRRGLLGNLFTSTARKDLEDLLQRKDEQMISNKNDGIRWVRPELLPALRPSQAKPLLEANKRDRKLLGDANPQSFFRVHRYATTMQWEKEAKALHMQGPKVDYTKHSYTYPEKMYEVPTLGTYPPLVPLRDLMERWHQDDIDNPPTPYPEALFHFDYSDPKDLEAARKFRDAKLPFKLINVPEVAAAGAKWTDEYVSKNFDGDVTNPDAPLASGTAQESTDNFFAFFAAQGWMVDKMGVPPTRNNDYTFAKWAEHARYADATGLHPHQPHFYYQAGVEREERFEDPSKWTFISRDLPSFSSPSATFFMWNPDAQKGIQCRFGERGVTAATHYDSGMNMVAMMTGAKRYVLSPPSQCSKMGIVTARGNAEFRHSMLNFGHMNETSNVNMPEEEREWLERAGDTLSLDTVLKAGEVLYIPSHWFHYITSLQKSAQCNVRSGVDAEGDSYFGGKAEVTTGCDPLQDH
eukprot:Nitzschia sp. Nitz4//scaffold16_size188269//136796//138448//NITZ4_001809-RA/size188269-processed-gene-0.63-mRNA-1//-1//CDS//3329538571//4052//frame0